VADTSDMKIWEGGELRDVAEPGVARRVALATLSCPLAFFVAGRPNTVRIGCQELEACALALGHAAPSAAVLAEEIAVAAEVHDGAVCAAVLVPTTLPSTGISAWAESESYVFRFDAPADDVLLRAAVFGPPVNERGAAIHLRVTGDGEIGVAARWARDERLDMAIRVNLEGHLARVDRWSLVVASTDGPVTPPQFDGAPTDLWRDALVRAGAIGEATVTPDALRQGAAFISGWGRAYALVTDASDPVEARALAHQLNAVLAELT
jgi:hypothetical protein